MSFFISGVGQLEDITFFFSDDSQSESLSLTYTIDHLSAGGRLFLKSLTIASHLLVEGVRAFVSVPSVIGHVGWNTTGSFDRAQKFEFVAE